MTTSLSRFRTHIYLIVDIGEDVLQFGEGTVFGELHRGEGFLLRLVIDFLELFVTEDSLLLQAILPKGDGIVVLFIEFDLLRLAVDLGVGVRDGVAVVAVGIDLENAGLALLSGFSMASKVLARTS